MPLYTSVFSYLYVCLFGLFIYMFDLILYVPSRSFSYIGKGLPGLNQYKARTNVSCSRTQRGDAGEARTHGLLVSSQALYH